MPSVEDLFQFPLLQEKPVSSYNFEVGELLFKSGNFRKSVPHLQQAMQDFVSIKDFDAYISCYQLLFKGLNELGETKALQQLNEKFEDVCKTFGIEKTTRALNYSAYYAIYVQKDNTVAKQYLDEALQIAFSNLDNYLKTEDCLKQISTRFSILECLCIYSIYYSQIEDYEKCEKELKNLEILLEDYSNLEESFKNKQSKTDSFEEIKFCHEALEIFKKNQSFIQKLKLSIRLLEAEIQNLHFKDYKQANKIFWEVYEQANKTSHTYFIPHILCALSRNCLSLENKNQAEIYFNLAEKHTSKDRKLLVSYMEYLKKTYKLGQKEEKQSHDIIFDLKEHTLVEKEKGCIEIKNQFILMDLFKLFLLNPGVPYSKEQIVQKIWKQEYLPQTHDNKIYVTIKRLREIIEVNSCKPRYICRNSSGYYFSTSAKVLVIQ